MSLSDSRPMPAATKSKIILKNQAVALMEKSVKTASSDPIKVSLVFMVMVTGLGEILTRPLSFAWYLILCVLIGLYIYEKKQTKIHVDRSN